MSDGSLEPKYKKSLLLHTQGFSPEENLILSGELNEKFGLHTTVVKHYNKGEVYSIIFIPTKDASLLLNLIEPYMIPSMEYKLPRGNIKDS